MSVKRSMPPSVIIPKLPYPDVREAVEWLCRTFGFAERLGIGNPRAQLSFGRGSLVVTQKNEDASGSFSVMVRVDDIDRYYEQSQRTGAQIVSPPTEYPYGERQTWGGILFEA